MSDTMIFGHFRRLTATALLALLAACAGGPDGARNGGADAAPRSQKAVLQAGFACCNLHYDGDTITDSNFGQLPFLPAGSPVKIRQIDGYVAHVDIGGRPLRLVLEHRGQETMQEWLDRIVVGDDPKAKIAAFPPNVRDAIAAGKLVKGMTREQAVMAVGYPQTNEKMRFEGPSWRYWWSGFAPYYVYWNGNKLVRVDGQAEVVGAMTFKAGK
jgi:hypothetical protein